MTSLRRIFILNGRDIRVARSPTATALGGFNA